jgi:hypothetical protein
MKAIRESIEIRVESGGGPVCAELGTFVDNTNRLGVVSVNPRALFPPMHEGSRSLSGINVRVAETHVATITTTGCVRGEVSTQELPVLTVQDCEVRPSQRCAGCILRLVDGVVMQTNAMRLSTPKI